jgi:hypothetical protein
MSSFISSLTEEVGKYQLKLCSNSQICLSLEANDNDVTSTTRLACQVPSPLTEA